MKRLLIILILLLTSFNLFSGTTPKIFLATIGPGDELFLRWGHFAIIVDYEDQKDRLYDYGNFSFQQADFVPNFIKGVMTYFKYRKSADYELREYILANRTITLQELNLTPEQVYIYIDKLRNEIKPENMYYQYDHYYNNCVSQMSDFLDELTDGAFYQGTSKKTGRSFRDLSRDYISSNYLYNNLIMFTLGSKVDYDITEKESLFLPDYTMARADEVMISDGAGGLKPLVKNKTIINQSEGRDPVIINAKPKILLNLLVGIFIALISMFINKNRYSSAIFSIIMGLVIGLCGSVLFFMAFFTGHYYIHDNWNLIFVNPFGLLLLVTGIMKLSSSLNSSGEKISKLYVNITLIATILMIIFKGLGLIIQGNGEIITLITPLLIVNSSLLVLIKNQLGSLVKLSDRPSRSTAASKSASLDESITTD